MTQHRVPDQPVALSGLGEIGHYLAELWQYVRKMQLGDPALHALTHLKTGTDPIPGLDGPDPASLNEVPEWAKIFMHMGA